MHILFTYSSLHFIDHFCFLNFTNFYQTVMKISQIFIRQLWHTINHYIMFNSTFFPNTCTLFKVSTRTELFISVVLCQETIIQLIVGSKIIYFWLIATFDGCLSICLFVCLSVCLSVCLVYAFEVLDDSPTSAPAVAIWKKKKRKKDWLGPRGVVYIDRVRLNHQT